MLEFKLMVGLLNILANLSISFLPMPCYIYLFYLLSLIGSAAWGVQVGGLVVFACVKSIGWCGMFWDKCLTHLFKHLFVHIFTKFTTPTRIVFSLSLSLPDDGVSSIFSLLCKWSFKDPSNCGSSHNTWRVRVGPFLHIINILEFILSLDNEVW